MAEPDIKLGFDGKPAEVGLDRVRHSMEVLTKRFYSMERVSLSMSKATDLMTARFQILNTHGQRVNHTWAETWKHGKKLWKDIAVSIATADLHMVQTNKTSRRMQASIRESFKTIELGAGGGQVLQKEIQQLERWIKTNRIVGPDVDRIWGDMAKGQIRNYQGSMAKVQGALMPLFNLHQKLGVQAVASAEKQKQMGLASKRMTNTVRRSFDQLKLAGPGKELLNKEILQLQKFMKANKTVGVTADRIWAELRRGEIKQYNGELLHVQNSLMRITGLHKQISATRQGPGRQQRDVIDPSVIRESTVVIDKLAKSFREAGASAAQITKAEGHIKRLRDVTKKYHIDVKTINRIWREVSRGSIKVYSGMQAEVQKQLMGIHALQHKVAAGTRKVSQSQKKASQHTKEMLVSWRSMARLIVTSAIHRSFYKIIESIREATTLALDFGIAISEVRTIDTARMATDELNDSLVKLSNSYGLTVLEQAEAMYQTLSNQVADGAEAITFLDSANRLAKATVSQTSDAVNVLTSAINAWGLRTSEAEKLNARFFKTIELGRIRLDEMGNVFGRVALPAAQLGVEVEELLTMLAQTTIKGVRLSEAMTFVRNIFQKLIRPTEEMKDAFAEWGVESGEQLIRAHGIAGALAMIEERTKGSSSELGKLFGRIRAIAGGMVFAGKGVKEFETTLAELHASGPSYIQAIEDVMTATSKRVRLELNEVQNAFLTEFSQPLVKVIAYVNESVFDFSDAVKSILPTMKKLPLVIGGVSGALTILALSMKSVTLATVSSAGMVFATAGVAAALAGLAIMAVAYAHALGQVEEAQKRQANMGKILADQAEAARKARAAMLEEEIFSGVDKGVKGIMTKIQQIAVHGRKKITEQIGIIFKKLEDSERELGINVNKTRKAFSDAVSKAADNFNQIDSVAKSMRASITAMLQSVRDLNFNIAIRGAGDLDAKLKLIEERMSGLQRAREGGLAVGASMKGIEAASVKISNMIMDQQKLIGAGVAANKDLIKDLMQAGHDLERQRRDMLFDIKFEKQSNLAGKLQTIRLEIGRLNKEASFLEKIIFNPDESVTSKNKAFERYNEIADQIIGLEQTARKEAKATGEANKKISEEHRDLNRKDSDEANKDLLAREALEEQLAVAKKTRNRKDRKAAIKEAEKDMEAHQKKEYDFEAQQSRDRQSIDPKQDVPSMPEMESRYNSIIDKVQKIRKALVKAVEEEMEKRLKQEEEVLLRLDSEIEKRREILSLTKQQAAVLEGISLGIGAKKENIAALTSAFLGFDPKTVSGAGSEEELERVMAKLRADVAELKGEQQNLGLPTGIVSRRLKEIESMAKNRQRQLDEDLKTGARVKAVEDYRGDLIKLAADKKGLERKIFGSAKQGDPSFQKFNDAVINMPDKLASKLIGKGGKQAWRGAWDKFTQEGEMGPIKALMKQMWDIRFSTHGADKLAWPGDEPVVRTEGDLVYGYNEKGRPVGKRVAGASQADVTGGQLTRFRATKDMIGGLLAKFTADDRKGGSLTEMYHQWLIVQRQIQMAIKSISALSGEAGPLAKTVSEFDRVAENMENLNKHIATFGAMTKDIGEIWDKIPKEQLVKINLDVTGLEGVNPETQEQVAKSLKKAIENGLVPKFPEKN